MTATAWKTQPRSHGRFAERPNAEQAPLLVDPRIGQLAEDLKATLREAYPDAALLVVYESDTGYVVDRLEGTAGDRLADFSAFDPDVAQDTSELVGELLNRPDTADLNVVAPWDPARQARTILLAKDPS